MAAVVHSLASSDKDAEEWRLRCDMSQHAAAKTVFQRRRVEVDQQAYAAFAYAQIGKQLGFMDLQDAVDLISRMTVSATMMSAR